jgi:hypothetical protein
MSSGLIIPNAPPANCGNCKWGATLPDLQFVECTALPPSVHLLGVRATPGGPQLDTQLMRPNCPRALPACSLFEVAKE